MKKIVAASGLISLIIVSGATPVFALSVANNSAAQDQARMVTIKAKGDQEITRRLKSLNNLTSRINSATKLSATNKSALSNEVTSEVSGLTALKIKLDADTTLDGTKADTQSIVQDYRVYALIVPKVWLVKTADDQQVVESKLTTLKPKLQTRILNAQKQGKNVGELLAEYYDMENNVQKAQTISSSVEQEVIDLQPSDFDSNHAVLSGDRDQLKTARGYNQVALNEAKTIVNDLKNL